MYYPLTQEELELNQIPQEVWLPVTDQAVPSVQPYYYVSTYGNVWSDYSKRYLYQTVSPTSGYLGVILSTIDGIKHIDVHRLIMLTFNYIPGCEKLVVNHKDNIITHNWIWNLEWMTQSENIKYAYDNNNAPLGEDKTTALLTNEQVHMICRMLCEVKPYRDILIAIGIDVDSMTKKEYHNYECLINNIKHKKAWTFISKDYNIPVNAVSKQRLSESEVRLICEYMVNNLSYDEILCKLNYDKLDKKDKRNIKNILSAIKNKRAYAYISDEYF